MCVYFYPEEGESPIRFDLDVYKRQVHLDMLFAHIPEHRFIGACHAGKRLPFLILTAELLQRYRPVCLQNIFPDTRFTPESKFRSRKGLLHDSIRPDLSLIHIFVS